MQDDFLEHFGIKGMKWGIRRKNPSGSGTKGKAKETGSKKGKSSSETAKTLTDTELKKRIARLELEKRYSDLSTTQQKSTMSRGSKVAKEIVGNAAKAALTEYTRKKILSTLEKPARSAARVSG